MNGVIGLMYWWTSSAVPRSSSGPGRSVARFSTMKLVAGVPGIVQRIIRLQRDEHEAVAAFLVIRSRPWSKNWPKIVKKLLNGADRPLSGVTFGMNRLWARPGMVELLLEAVGVARLPYVVMSIRTCAENTIGASERWCRCHPAVPYMPSGPGNVVF